ncbi:MAG: AraC family transcriptional regulator [Myxococcales bacterium]|nr:AraC family transcriptional regulator [Myxococcales bacterium]
MSVATRAVVDACAELGLDTQGILHGAGLSPALIADADKRIAAESADALWERAYEVAEDPHLALHAAEALPFGAYKVLDFIVANAPTLGEGLARVLHYFPIVDPRGNLTIGEQAGDFVITMEAEQGALPGPAQEFTFAALVLRSRACTEVAWPPKYVNFTMEKPNNSREHERIFECPIRFGQSRAQLVLSRETWDLPVSGSNSALFGVLEEHATRLLNELPSVAQPPSLLDRVRAVLREELRGGDVKAVHVAKRLGFGERTLQRRLGEFDTTYLEVLANAREEMAREYLREPGISLTEVAFLLGFADQSSFTRAFKRWTGKSPGDWRTTMPLPETHNLEF